MQKIDYFELYEKKDDKSEITINRSFILNLVHEISNTQVNKIEKKLEITPSQERRKVEIEAIKAELFLLRTNGTTRVNKIDKVDNYRRKELIYCKKILQSEILYNNITK